MRSRRGSPRRTTEAEDSMEKESTSADLDLDYHPATDLMAKASSRSPDHTDGGRLRRTRAPRNPGPEEHLAGRWPPPRERAGGEWASEWRG
jgi:hypothetical protein